MAFWLIVIISLAVAGALLVIPVIRKNENKRVTTRDELNKAIYRDRLSELAEDEAQGVIAERPELVKELQQNLLTDIPQQLGEVKKPDQSLGIIARSRGIGGGSGRVVPKNRRFRAGRGMASGCCANA